MKPIVVAFWFDRHEKINRYSQYAKVWEYSAKKHIKSADIICKAVNPPDYKQECPVFYRGDRKIGPSKTLSWLKKIDLWMDLIEEYPDRPVLLCDIDIAFFGDPWPEIMKLKWDVGYCGNNTGAIYFRGNKKSYRFMKKWFVITHLLFNNADVYQKYDKKYKGLDQASFGWLLESGYKEPVQLPRRFHSIWNDFEDPCYLMHYHSAMRSAIFGNKEMTGPVKRYFDGWNEYLEAASK